MKMFICNNLSFCLKETNTERIKFLKIKDSNSKFMKLLQLTNYEGKPLQEIINTINS